MVKGLLKGAEIQSQSIIAQSDKTPEQKAFALVDLWIEVAESIVNIFHFVFTGKKGSFSIKKELIKQFISCLKKVKEAKQ